MQEHINLSVEIFDLLKDGRQLSISGITRELKKRGIHEHRLIVTGYLRALNDLKRLNEFDLSPSKIYTLPSQMKLDPEISPFQTEENLKKAAASGQNSQNLPDEIDFSESDEKIERDDIENEVQPDEKDIHPDIYRIVEAKISHLTPAVRLETAVYLYTTLFERPCFETELAATGIDPHQISRYFNGTDLLAYKSKTDKKYYDDFLEIPRGTQAFEIHIEKLDLDFLIRTIKILNSILKDEIDVSKLVSKKSTKSLLDFQ
ncbi:hypothetical protein MsAm2_04770 [Methanolapillus ohkumae]|uniref:Uncharacterized protein n=2 Tax=Methanolapillus ohkumae TaxID=3028298 RepID=A0AA96ZVH2_9EURY|nr:hypothetical protein MsAm2_04770 [Methanosarcinaceae archaeon Am2]